MTSLKEFYDYIKVPKAYNCINTISNGTFSRNTFIKNFEALEWFVERNDVKDCYINYQPLITNENRKTENVQGVNVLAFDIECMKKKTPESEENMRKLREYIYNFINYQNITDYMLINSGNGYHLYIDIGKVIEGDTNELKLAYKNMIKYFSLYFIKISSGFISSDDRKDLAGILRIPGTYNTKASREVYIVDIRKDGENILIRKLFFRMLKEVKKNGERMKIHHERIKKQQKNVPLPKNIDELLDHPLVRILFDKTLSNNTSGSWHNSIIFALQAIIYHAGLQNKHEITQLSREVNMFWGISMDLASCSYTDDIHHPINCAIRFCKNNKYTKYEQELKKLYYKNEDN